MDRFRRSPRSDEPRTYRVSQLMEALKSHLARSFQSVSVHGEVSGTSFRSSACYFQLNDEQAGVAMNVALFPDQAQRLRVDLRELLAQGARVIVRGKVTLFRSGSLSIIAQDIQPVGDGSLRANFRRIALKLKAEGLLDPARRRPLPLHLRTLGVVTSAQGAALRDVIKVAQRRARLQIVVADCRVQGPDAAESVLRALHAIQKLPTLDAVILTRGGGSEEQLWTFNDKALARAVAGCRVPIITGVGHESDTTMVDLVADLRAATPSNAAELAITPHASLRDQLEGLARRVGSLTHGQISRARVRLHRHQQTLRDPGRSLAARRSRLDALSQALADALRRSIAAERRHLSALHARLAQERPSARLQRDRAAIQQLELRLITAMRAQLQQQRAQLHQSTQRARELTTARQHEARAQLRHAMATLDALSPLRVLERGYSLAFKGEQLLKSVRALAPGDPVELRLSDGSATLEVRSIAPASEDP